MPGIELNLAEKIAVTRGRLRETQETFAARFGVRALAVTNWENGKSEPKKKHRPALDQLFRSVLDEEDDSEFESASYQLQLPFDEPVKIDIRFSPLAADRVRLGMQIRRKLA
jgi:transcriptional regulator with XRE-family HTH domain